MWFIALLWSGWRRGAGTALVARWLGVVPILWGVVAGWAAVGLNVWPDYVLFLAAIVAASDLVAHLFRRESHGEPPSVMIYP